MLEAQVVMRCLLTNVQSRSRMKLIYDIQGAPRDNL